MVMSANGYYLAQRVRLTAIPYIRAYGEWVYKLLPTLEDFEERRQELAAAEYEQIKEEFPGKSYEIDLAAAAYFAQQQAWAFYDTSAALRQTTLNLFAAGLFHLLEQQLADVCHDGSLLDGSQIQPPNDTQIKKVVKWYRRHFDLDLRTLANWKKIDELCLVANSVKHGEGGSAQKLRERRPELFQDPILGELSPRDWTEKQPVRNPLAGEDLYITEEVFKEYSESANGFVSEIAEHFEEHGEHSYPMTSRKRTAFLSSTIK